MMVRIVNILLFLLLINEVFSVDRGNFKTCKQSSFCARQHALKSGERLYAVLNNTINHDKNGVSCLLKSENSNQTLSLTITYLAYSTFRIFIDDSTGVKRFRIPVGDVLTTQPKPYPIDIKREKEHILLLGKNKEKLLLNFSPFRIDIFLNEMMISRMNADNLFNFEDSSESIVMPVEDSVNNETSKNMHSVEDAESVPNSDTSDSVSDDSSELNPDVNNSPTENESTESSATNENPEQELPNEVHNDNDPEVKDEPVQSVSWSESFKEHIDSRPNGPSSISIGVEFPGFSHAYGIPEHADNLVLADTGSDNPYRLYNLDVFEYELYEKMALYGSVPILWTLNSNYSVGIFWNNPSETWVDVNYEGRPSDGFFSRLPSFFSSSTTPSVKTRWISESGVLDAFIMLGNLPSDVTKAYTHLTGTTPLPPLFALGYHQCRWNYNSVTDVLDVDKGFDDNMIPMDVMWLDIEHTNGKRFFTWDAAKFPNPGEMVDKLLQKGRKLVTVVDPHLKHDTSWDIYQDFEKRGYEVKKPDGSTYIGWCWPGSSAWPDFTRPDVRKWWAELFLKYEPMRVNTMYSWNDMGEPSVFNGPEVTMHKDALHGDHWEHRDIHNLYGMYVHKATWDGQLLRSAGKERPFVLTRAFFAGSQRTSAVWTGDNTANWNHLEISIPMILSLSIAGITFSGADVGGFFGNPDPELLTRWYQAAAYQPFFRAHAHIDTKRREPWLMPEQNLRVIRSAIQDRYKLLPYWYTLFARSEADGQPVMAPMWYYFPKVVETFGMDKQYMLGEAVLVRPVTTSGASKVDVYLPPGHWYHVPSLRSFVGDQTIYFPVDLSTIPVFYRAGWIVPRRERIRRSSWLMRHDPYTLFVCLDSNVSEAFGFLYLDDFHSVSRTSAQFYRIEYRANVDAVGKHLGGGWLQMHRIPLPGTTVLAAGDQNESDSMDQIERIVFLGLTHPLQRATVIAQDGSRRNLQVLQKPNSSADKVYFGEATSNVVVIAHASLPVNSDWRLHLAAEHEGKDDL